MKICRYYSQYHDGLDQCKEKANLSESPDGIFFNYSQCPGWWRIHSSPRYRVNKDGEYCSRFSCLGSEFSPKVLLVRHSVCPSQSPALDFCQISVCAQHSTNTCSDLNAKSFVTMMPVGIMPMPGQWEWFWVRSRNSV